MEAVVLAGGYGTRLRHIVSNVPKPMAPVCGRPFLRYILDDLTDKGVDRIILAVGYMKEAIIDYFGNFYRGAKILYSIEDDPLLTGGAIKKALALCEEENILIVNGDTFFDVDLIQMKNYQSGNQAALVIAVKEMTNFDRYGTILTEDGRIVSFEEKKECKKGLINGGIYLMKKNLLDKMPEVFSFEKDFMEKYNDIIPILAYESKGYFIDIGIAEDYEKAQFDFLEKSVKKNKAAFFDRDGTINVEVDYLYKIEDFRFIDGMPQFIKRYNDMGYKVIVVTNQAGIARGYYAEEDMHKLHRHINRELAKTSAKIDAFYFCPHHPDFTGPCHCRKPETGMLETAIRDFDIDVQQSVMFGDKPWDIECGKRLGLECYYINDCLNDR